MANLLVIDDEEGIRNLLDTLLRRKGYDVVLAESGTKGLDLFRHSNQELEACEGGYLTGNYYWTECGEPAAKTL